MNENYIDDDLRELIHHRDKGICQLCDKQGKWIRFGSRYFACQKGYSRRIRGITSGGERIWTRFHVDHIIPKILDGTSEEDNLRLLCPKCNLSRKKYEVV